MARSSTKKHNQINPLWLDQAERFDKWTGVPFDQDLYTVDFFVPSSPLVPCMRYMYKLGPTPTL